MDQLSMYIKEYLAICSYLDRTKSRSQKGYFILSKEELEYFLNKNKYEESFYKLKIWKQLKWIDADGDRITKRVYNASLKKYEPLVKIDIEVYETMNKLNGKRV